MSSVKSGFTFSTAYVASPAALPLPTFLTAWIVLAGVNTTSARRGVGVDLNS
ncbi:MAG: hypothetical protein ACJ74J_00855 [Blastocatellia bacterium]